MIEIRETGNGQGKGVFAICNIPKGTRALAEAPIILLLDGEKPFTRFRTAAGLLPADIKSQIQELCANAALFDLSTSGNAKKLMLSEVDDGTHEDLKVLTTQIALYAKFLANRVEVKKSGKRIGTALCPTIGRLNQSCLPNAYHSWNAKLGQSTLHAGRDINKGEQLFINYLPNQGAFLEKSQRQRLLDKSWRFHCRCAACADAGADAIDKVRINMELVHKDLEGISEKTLEPGIVRKKLQNLARKAVVKVDVLVASLAEVGLGGSTLCAA